MEKTQYVFMSSDNIFLNSHFLQYLYMKTTVWLMLGKDYDYRK